MVRILITLTLLLPLTAFGQVFGYEPLVNLPGGIGDPAANFNEFLNALYAIAIVIAALLAVIKIVIAGVKYMLSDVVTSKASAKADIQGALLGLIIVIGAFLILNTINPGITTGDLSRSTPRDLGAEVAANLETPIAPIEALEGIDTENYTYLVRDEATPFARSNFLIDCEGESTIERGQIRCYKGNLLKSEQVCRSNVESRGGRACRRDIDAWRAENCADEGNRFAVEPSIEGYPGTYATCIN